ncbi:hypothetical protein [Spiroplasma platyhelix]|uniref:Lipoprotein n=1 Tax=Spiroplasma platyhelix PALS-1 TaxID=1276218 RepID=A0A846U1D3_9MOLU|nr:hypothetical protein [Spiroplasma platyhelix]NKE38319.1 hypothetical protein [Spiroplasma platyhelix PALS-1]
MNFKKILSSISLLAVAVPSALSVVACGAKEDKAIPKIELDTVIKDKEVDGNIVNDADKVLQEIEAKNAEVKGAVTIKDFKAATQLQVGSAVIVAKPDTKFTGEVSITIKTLAKTQLSDVLKNKEVDGDTTEATVVDQVLKNNSDSNVQKTDLQVVEFKPAGLGVQGSAVLGATKNSKFTGQVVIEITAQEKISLESVLTNRKVTIEITNPDDLLVEVAKLNNRFDLTKDVVDVKNFVVSSEQEEGSAVIVAKPENKFVGQVEITIEKKDQYGIGITVKRIKESPTMPSGWMNFFKYYQDQFIESKTVILSKEQENNIDKYAEEITNQVLGQAMKFVQEKEKYWGLEEFRDQYVDRIELEFNKEDPILLKKEEYKISFQSKIVIYSKVPTGTIWLHNFYNLSYIVQN